MHALLKSDRSGRSASTWADSRCTRRVDNTSLSSVFLMQNILRRVLRFYRAKCYPTTSEGADITQPVHRNPVGTVKMSIWRMVTSTSVWGLSDSVSFSFIRCFELSVFAKCGCIFEKGHSRQCPSLRCKEHYMIFFCCLFALSLSSVCTDFLGLFLFVSTADERWVGDCGHQFLTAVNEGFH